jgi:hypothetical protein
MLVHVLSIHATVPGSDSPGLTSRQGGRVAMSHSIIFIVAAKSTTVWGGRRVGNPLLNADGRNTHTLGATNGSGIVPGYPGS